MSTILKQNFCSCKLVTVTVVLLRPMHITHCRFKCHWTSFNEAIWQGLMEIHVQQRRQALRIGKFYAANIFCRTM